MARRFARRRDAGPAEATNSRVGATPLVPGYTDLAVIGRGASATVYSATQEAFGRTVALKLLHIDVSDRRAQRRFEREKAISGRLSNHPNVVTVLDTGFVDHRYPYLAMEYFELGSLSRRLAQRGAFPVADVLHIGVRIAGALHSAHSMGILHRDVKPQNILQSRFGEPALADFGIATILELEQSLTAALTPVHAAPEILEGDEPSPAADVYALGSTLYTLLSGAPPFAGPSGEGVLAQLLRITTMELPQLGRPDVPGELFDVMRRATAKQPSERIGDAATLGRELQAIQALIGSARTTLPLDTPGPEADAEPPSSSTPSPRSLPPPVMPAAPSNPAPPPLVDEPTIGTDAGATTVSARQVQHVVAQPGRNRRWALVGAVTIAAVAAGASVAYVATRVADDDAGGATTVVPATAAVTSAAVDSTAVVSTEGVSTEPVDTSEPSGPEPSVATARLAPTDVSWTESAGRILLTWSDQAPDHDLFVEITWSDGRRVQHLVPEGQRTTYLVEDADPTDDVCFVVRAYLGTSETGTPLTADSSPLCIEEASASPAT